MLLTISEASGTAGDADRSGGAAGDELREYYARELCGAALYTSCAGRIVSESGGVCELRRRGSGTAARRFDYGARASYVERVDEPRRSGCMTGTTCRRRVDANNVLNHVAYSGWNTTVGPLFGTAAGAGGMRSVADYAAGKILEAVVGCEG